MSRGSNRERRFFEVDSRINASWDTCKELQQTPDSQRRYEAEIGCPQCHMPRAEWDAEPFPIDMDVTSKPQGCVDNVPGYPRLFHEELFNILKPYLRGNTVGTVRAVNEYGELRVVPYVTSFAPRKLLLETERGRYCRHFRCRICGWFGQRIGWASGGIVERYLDDRLVYHNTDGDLFVDELVIEKLDLRRRIPDIKLYRYDVIPEPLDGDILPGDPGWTGEFHPQHGLPKGPEIMWAGRSTSGESEDVTGEGWVTLYIPESALAESALDTKKIKTALASAVRTAQVGDLEEQGTEQRKHAWFIRFHGPNMDRLFEVMRDATSKFWQDLPTGYYFTARLKDGRERRISKHAT